MCTLRKGLKSLKVACGIFAVLTSPAAFAQQKVDTVVTNGKILTVDASFRVDPSACGQQLTAVSAQRQACAEMARYAGPNTKVIDVGVQPLSGRSTLFAARAAVDRWHQQARFEGVDSRREAAPRRCCQGAA